MGDKMKNKKNIYNETWLLFSICILISAPLKAEDIYNFYFQKSSTLKKEKLSKAAKESHDTKEEKENIELKEKKESQKIEEEEIGTKKSVQGHSKNAKNDTKSASDLKTWVAQAGLGWINGLSFWQQSVSLGFRYNISKYLDLNSELYVPNGRPDSFKYNNYENKEELKPIWFGTVGVGITPIHIAFFGSESMAIGIDGGLSFGARTVEHESEGFFTNLIEDKLSSYLGPRLSLLFNEQLSLVISAKIDTKYNESNSSMTLAYNW